MYVTIHEWIQEFATRGGGGGWQGEEREENWGGGLYRMTNVTRVNNWANSAINHVGWNKTQYPPTYDR